MVVIPLGKGGRKEKGIRRGQSGDSAGEFYVSTWQMGNVGMMSILAGESFHSLFFFFYNLPGQPLPFATVHFILGSG